MALQSITNINIDFCDKKYILVNAKQLDKSSRLISVTCYNHGEIYSINSGEHSVYIRYKKADDYAVLNSCKIDKKGKILVELTEQMLSAEGMCCADLVIANKGSASIDAETGKITTIDNASILSTMPLYIDVTGTAVDNLDIESSYEYNALNELLTKAEADYEEVILASKSWAVGGTGTRNNEDKDNAKYYSKQASNSASSAKTSEENASKSENLADGYMKNANLYCKNAKSYMDSALESKNSAKSSEDNAKASQNSAKSSATQAKNSEDNAYDYYMASKRYAVGGTNTDANEDIDNAKYYYQQVKGINDSLNGVVSPKGTILFEELATVDKAVGYLYFIEDSFVTDDTFVGGANVEHPAGTAVYYTVDGYWDCLDGYSWNVATVSEVKDYLGI